MVNPKRISAASLCLAAIVLTSSSFISQGCGDKPATGPVTVTQIAYATPPPNTVAGRDWTYATLGAAFPARSDGAGLVYNNQMWMIGGASNLALNDAWSSGDGIHWNQVLADTASPGPNQFSRRVDPMGLVFNTATGSGTDGRLWIIGGQSSSLLNDVWSSSDGAAWTNVLADHAVPATGQFPRRTQFAGVVSNGKMWVLGGQGNPTFLNDVWSSSDGVTWTNVLSDTASPGSNQFSRRCAQTALFFNNKMWMIGGYDGANYLNDVWSSTDGVTWTRVLANNPSPGAYQFPVRAGQANLVYGGALWVLGGYNGTYLHDVWYSSDGHTWLPLTLSASFPARAFFPALVFNNDMWVIGGGPGLFNDVWYSPF